MTCKKEIKLEKDTGRRRFLKNTALLTGAAGAAITGASAMVGPVNPPIAFHSVDASNEELLYNGITLPSGWPPRYIDPKSYDPMPVPYLASPPKIIPIDIGRQLFVDDFLIEYTTLKRKFHQPVKFKGNPILKPQTLIELNHGYCPMAAPFSDGIFFDTADNLFKMWYMAGWFDGTALATSVDGIHWDRPTFDVVPGTNLVIAPRDDFRRDGVSVWIDHDTEDPASRYKMYYYAREGKIGATLKPVGGFLLKSADGIHWKWGSKISGASDNNTFFYNPFRKKWVFTIRREARPIPPWSNFQKRGGGRARSYWENSDFEAALNQWDRAAFWFGADKKDKKRPGYSIGEDPQIYKLDAVGYESLLIGLIQPHYGPSNEICAKGGYPKLTELQMAFSRDGFHWDRSCRETFIGAYPDKKDIWERAYIHSVGGVCNVVGDKLHFYYTAFKGNQSNRNPNAHWNGMYANAATGLAILRRDGLASMEADKNEGFLLTRPLKFSGNYLFVNVDNPQGKFYVEICNEDGQPMPGFTKNDCLPISIDSTKQIVTWKNGNGLQALPVMPMRFKFHLTNSKLFAFWVSKDKEGKSGGAIAAGGPGLTGNWDR
jgi:hypothetical protein